MERLTKRDTDGQAMMDCQKCKADWTGKHGKPMADCTALYCRNRLKDRLAAYEDTWLMPKEIAAMRHTLDEYHKVADPLLRAQADGRLVVLPSNKALTNADRMRTATNQQLAKQLYDTQKELCRILYEKLGFEDELNFSEDYSDILAWLNAPSKEAEKALEAMKDE